MNKLKFLLLLIFCLGSFSAFSQTTLSLKPFIGNQDMLCRYDSSIGKSEFVEVNEIYRWNKDKLNGLTLELKLNENWRISAGYSREWLRWNYRVVNPERTKSKFGGLV